MACIGLLVLGLSAFFQFQRISKSQPESLIALNKAFKNQRPVEARITDFDYAPLKNERGNNNESFDKTNFDLAKMLALKDASENRSAENLYALGRIYLTEKKLNDAIEQFENALETSPNLTKLHNDLGIAFMEKALEKEEGSLELFAKANEEFAKVIESDKNLPEAHFNQAICIEHLNLPNQAKEAWENYLKLDSNSQWANEAKEHLQILKENKPISKTKEDVLQDFLKAKRNNDEEKAWQTLSRNREMITGKLIPQQLIFLFVDSKNKVDEAKAKEALDALFYAGKLEEEKSGDLYWRDIDKFYSNVAENKIPMLKKAEDLMRDAYELRFRQKYAESLEKFVSSKTFFAKAGNTAESKMCDYWIAQHFFQLNRLSESNEIFNDLANLGETKKYKWIATQALVRLAYAVSSDNNHSKAIEVAKNALNYAMDTNDIYNQQRIFSILAEDYKSLGRIDISLQFSEKSLKIGRLPEASLRQKWRDYETVTLTFQEIQFYDTSLSFQKEALEVTKADGDKHNEQVSYVYLARLYMFREMYDKAEQFIKESIKIASGFPDEEVRKRSLAHSTFQYGQLRRLEKRYDEAISFLDEAGSFYDGSEYHLGKYSTHKEKLLTFLKINDANRIRAELKIILDIFRTHRSQILIEQNRNSFFDNKQDIYEIAIDYEFGEGNYKDAFDYSEESRSRSLLDLQNSTIQVSKEENQPEIKFSPSVTIPLKLSHIQAELPDNVQILQYTILNDKLLIWLVTKDNLLVRKVEVSSEDLNKKVSGYLNLIKNNKELSEQLELSKQLYEILISPIAKTLDANKKIFIIPDKILFQLPFATLYSDKYLIENYEIAYAPSSNVFLFSTKRAGESIVKTEENLLSVGNPTFSREVFRDLQPLPSAKEEAEKIAKIYQNSTILTETDATKEQIKNRLKTSNIVHFAGHYIVNEKSPMLSSLVVAGKNEEKASLANYEIIGEKLSQTRLIILSACQTGVEKYYNGEGMIGASRTFLAVGVPIVVASQWEVDSEATKELMIRFHHFRGKEKLPTIEALRRAQLEMLHNEKYKQPYYWAGFATLGGYAKF